MGTLRGSRAIAAAAVLMAAARAAAIQDTYTGATGGNWNVSGNWTTSSSTHAVPAPGDDAVMGTVSGPTSVNFNMSYASALNSLTIDPTIPVIFTLNQTTGGTVMLATTETLGATSDGATYNQSAGNNTMTTLNLGLSTSSIAQGLYQLSGTGNVSATTENIGNSSSTFDGGNLFQQTGGSNVVTNLNIGAGTSGIGCYTINAGTLSAGTLVVGKSLGVGSTFSQSGTGSTSSSNGIILGFSSGQTGTFLLGGGTVQVTNFEFDVGQSGTGNMAHSAGSLTLSGANSAVVLGVSNASTGNLYTLSGTGTISGEAKIEVGRSGNGTFTQTGGVVTAAVGATLFVGENASSVGTYNLSNTTGAGNLTIDNESIGNSGNGTFVQNSGNNTVGTLTVGVNGTGVGNYTLNGGTLTVNTRWVVGHDGNGTFTQTGGTVNAGGSTILYLGDDTGTGTYVMNGNTSTPTLNAGYEEIGSLNNGNFLQSAGNNTIGTNLYLGIGTGATGCYSLSGGNLSVGSQAFIGTANGGNGTFTQTGGCATFLSLFVGNTGCGSYSMSNAGSTVIVNGAEMVGTMSVGTFTQGGGNHSVSGNLTLGNASTGTYNMNGGNLTISGSLIGATSSGTANFVQQAGNVTVTGGNIAVGQSGNASFSMSGGTLAAPALYVSAGGCGTFTQSGGTATFGTLFVNQLPGSLPGTVTLSGTNNPTLTVNGVENVGYAGNATFLQTGGTHIVHGDLQLASSFNAHATYEMDGGTLTETANLAVGQGGTGTLTQFGGNGSVAAAMYVAAQVGSTGTYNLNGGNMTALTVYNGYNGIGTINEAGGNLTVTNALYIGVNSGATAVFNLSGGTLGLPNSPGSLQYGFISMNGTFNESGGNVTGYLLNQGQFTFTGGSFGGSFENGVLGTANFTSSVLTGGTLKNHGTMNLLTGGQLGTQFGQTFSNDGLINLSNGQISSSGPFVNNGTLSGVGSLGGSGGFTNNLIVTQGNGTLNFAMTGGSFNLGTFTLATGHLFSLSSTLSNSGTFAVNGALVSSSGSLVNAAGGVVTGPGTITTNFSNAGTVAPGAGTLSIQSAWNNTGVVELSGITSALTGGAITNTGTIQGAGTVGSPIANTSGTIEALGGTLVLAGPLTNSTGTVSATITASTGNKILVTGGLSTNDGIISLTGGTFDNGGRHMINDAQITGYGTFRSGGLMNNGNITFSGTNGSTTTVNTDVTNNSFENIFVKFNPAIFTGNFTNSSNGLVKITNTTVTYGAAFTNNGTYTSDPSTNIFQGDVTSSGSMSGGAGDAFYMSGGNFSNSGTFANGGTLQSSDPSVNTGTFTQSGAQTWAASSTFVNNAGTATFNSDTGSVSTTPLAITVNAGNVNFGATQHLPSLNIQGGVVSVLAGVTKTNSLTFGGTTNAWVGRIDLTSAKLIVEDVANHAATLAVVKNEAGYGRTHAAGITSSALAINKTLVVSDNAIAGLTSFGGVNVDAGSILEVVAYNGDYNLDGVVDIKDLQDLANHWQQNVTDWSQADFDGNGKVELQDLQALANNWQAGVGSGGGGGEQSFAESLTAVFGGSAAVPEPMTLSVLGVGAGILVLRRRRA